MFGAREYARALEPLLPQAGGYALSILRRRADAEDAVQAAALRGLERLVRYDASRPFKGWWFAVLHNVCIDMLRQRGRGRPVPLTERLEAPQSEPEGPQWARLDAAIGRLGEAHQEVLRLRYFADLSYADMAEALVIPLGTVMSRLHAARLALAGAFGEWE